MIAGLRNDTWLRLDPPHPGRSIYHGCLEGNGDNYEGITIGEAADKLGINRVTLSRVVNGHARITTGLALKLEAAGWGAADSWLRRQANYDLAQARKRLNQPPWEHEQTDLEERRRTIGEPMEQYEKLMIYCPEIYPESFVHLSIKDEGYYIRAFTGPREFEGRWKQPVCPQLANSLNVFSSPAKLMFQEQKIA